MIQLIRSIAALIVQTGFRVFLFGEIFYSTDLNFASLNLFAHRVVGEIFPAGPEFLFPIFLRQLFGPTLIDVLQEPHQQPLARLLDAFVQVFHCCVGKRP